MRLLLVLVVGFFVGVKCLKYPLDDELIKSGEMLIPALPRPMTTKEDSPFHVFAKRKPHISIEAYVTDEDIIEQAHSLGENLFFVDFSAETEVFISYAFLYGYRIHDSSDIIGDMCDNLNIDTFKALGGDITSFTAEKMKFKKVKKKTAFVASIPITKSGYHYAFVLNCNSQPVTFEEGEMSFLNPHGYLPGGWYLKLPFSLLILVGYLVALLVFVVKSILYRKQLMFVQYGVMIVLFIGFLEQIATFGAYRSLNYSGHLPCCPVSKVIGITMVLSAIKRAAFVTFLLFVSLGYGIQRPNLRRYEYTAVAVIGVLYLFAAVNYELAEITEIDNSAEDNSGIPLDSTVFASLLLSVLNLIVVYWIYLSIINVIEELEKQQQEAKKLLYEKLIKSIIFWCVIGFFTETLFYSWLTHQISTPWKYDMVPRFVWDFLYFLIVVQVGWIWMPNKTTKQFAYAQQLPTEDFEDFDGADDETDDEIEFKDFQEGQQSDKEF